MENQEYIKFEGMYIPKPRNAIEKTMYMRMQLKVLRENLYKDRVKTFKYIDEFQKYLKEKKI